MHKTLHSIQLIRDYMEAKNLIKYPISNIDDIYKFFIYITNNENKYKFNSLYIFNYIEQYIVNEEVAKRKTSARIFEDLLAIIFKGNIADNYHRENLVRAVPDYFNLSKDDIAKNKREKIDVLFSNSYGVSIKTLMENNTEINLGAFEKRVLFDDFGLNLSERKGGLGSKIQLKNVFEKLKTNNFYEKFADRFIHMFNFIFSDDIIIAIKYIKKLKLYFLEGAFFTNFITSKVNNIDDFLTVINRWEGNSIRIDRNLLLDNCQKVITIDLSFLNDTIIKSINDFDLELHQTYVKYFNNKNNQNYKNNIFSKLDTLFKKFYNCFK